MATSMRRRLGRSGIEVSSMGLGCWAIGGPFWRDGNAVGWGDVDDTRSMAAIQRGLDLGVTFFDTADVYGTGHSEEVLGRALGKRRSDVVVATKFGNVFDSATRTITGSDASPEYVPRACEASLRRLGSDWIDLYQLHLGDYPLERVDDLLAALESLVEAGKIRAYAWSTDDPERARAFGKGEHCAAVQHQMNVFNDAAAMLTACEETNLASINRGPLAMGLLSGKYDSNAKLPDNDVRGKNSPPWMRYFSEGKPDAEFLKKLEAIRDILTDGGRTLVQGALGWIWARSGRCIPIPGFKTVEQVTENAKAMSFGPLSADALKTIDGLLDRN